MERKVYLMIKATLPYFAAFIIAGEMIQYAKDNKYFPYNSLKENTKIEYVQKKDSIPSKAILKENNLEKISKK